MVCSFPRATVTKYHKFGGLKEQKCVLSQAWRLEIQNKGVNKAMISLTFHCLFLASGGCSQFLGLWTCHSDLCLDRHVVFSLCVSIFSSYKDANHWIRAFCNLV